MRKVYLLKKRLITWFTHLSPRERYIVGIAVVGLLAYGASYPIIAVQENIEENKRIIVRREVELKNVAVMARRYSRLNQRLKKLLSSLDERQRTFEQVTAELDTMVKSSVGSDGYDLKKTSAPTAFSQSYEKQDISLEIKSISLEQLVKLLYELEKGNNPLFLARVDVTRNSRSGEFNVKLKIFSIRKQEGAQRA